MKHLTQHKTKVCKLANYTLWHYSREVCKRDTYTLWDYSREVCKHDTHSLWDYSREVCKRDTYSLWDYSREDWKGIGCWTSRYVSLRADFGRHYGKGTIICSIYVQLPAKTTFIPHVGRAYTIERENVAWLEQRLQWKFDERVNASRNTSNPFQLKFELSFGCWLLKTLLLFQKVLQPQY